MLKKTIALFIFFVFFAGDLQAGDISLTFRTLDCTSGNKKPVPDAELYASFFDSLRGENDFFHEYANDLGLVTIVLPSIALGETLTWSISSPPIYETSFGLCRLSNLGGGNLEICLRKKSQEAPKPPIIIIKKSSTWEVIGVLSFATFAYLVFAKTIQK
jgi:hypothetical protein